jgi:hypothetical protein
MAACVSVMRFLRISRNIFWERTEILVESEVARFVVSRKASEIPEILNANVSTEDFLLYVAT